MTFVIPPVLQSQLPSLFGTLCSFEVVVSMDSASPHCCN